MGRPWWHDSYWENRRPPRRRFQLPRRKVWIWIAVFILAVVLAAGTTGFRPDLLDWSYGLVYYLCRILMYAIIIRAVLSWFVRYSRNIVIVLLEDITEPLLMPLRKVIPPLGMFDLSPVVAILILYFIPVILGFLLP